MMSSLENNRLLSYAPLPALLPIVGRSDVLHILYIPIQPIQALYILCIICVEGGIVVATGGCKSWHGRVLASQHPGVGVATIGCCCPDGRVLARQHPGLGHINTRVLATSTPGCCDAKRGVLWRHWYIIDFQGVFFGRTTDNGQRTIIYSPHI